MSSIAEEAYSGIFENSSPYDFSLKYSGKFRDYNGLVRKMDNQLEFVISKKWKTVDRQIQIGMIQHLLLKILKRKAKTENIDLYNYFIKSLHITKEKTSMDPLLGELCDKVIDRMQLFDVEKPSLEWGSPTFRKLASYNYESDIVTVSSLFQGAPEELISYLIYHELLHKKFKFKESGGRTLHHSSEFKRWERMFPDSEELDKQLGQYVRKKKGILRMFW